MHAPLETTTDQSEPTTAEQVEALLSQLASCRDAAARQAIEQEVVSLTIDLADCAARRYRGRGVDPEDLTQVARLALVKAVRGYRCGKGHGFSAYAVPTVMGELKRYFRDSGWAVRPPRRLQEVRSSVASVEEQLRHQLMREPSPAEVAAAVGVSESDLDQARRAMSGYRTTSLESGSPDGSPIQLPDPGDQIDAVVTRQALQAAIGTLTERERQILHLRFVEERTQSDIGEAIGVSQMQVSRLLTSILTRLRTTLFEPAEAA